MNYSQRMGIKMLVEQIVIPEVPISPRSLAAYKKRIAAIKRARAKKSALRKKL